MRVENVRVLVRVWTLAERGLIFMVEWGLFLFDCWETGLRILSNPSPVYYFIDGFIVKRLFKSFWLSYFNFGESEFSIFWGVILGEFSKEA